jgi:hypothetical protein
MVHLAPEAPPVDVYLNGTAWVTSLAFGTGSDFIQLPAQNYDVVVRAAGSGADGAPIFEAREVALGAAGQSVDLAAIGIVGAPNEQAFRLRVYAIDRTPTNGGVRVQVIHAVPDGPAVDVLATGIENPLLVGGLAYPNGTDSALNLASGIYNLAVVPSGAQSPILLDLREVVLEADTIYTLYAAGRMNGLRAVILSSKTPALEAAEAAPTGEATPPVIQPTLNPDATAAPTPAG